MRSLTCMSRMMTSDCIQQKRKCHAPLPYEAKNTIIAVARPDCCADNDPVPLGLALHTVNIMGAFNYLSQPRRSALFECFL